MGVILRDQNAVLRVSSLAQESMNLGEACLSLPFVINRKGVPRVLSIPLKAGERLALEASAEILKHHITLDRGDYISEKQRYEILVIGSGEAGKYLAWTMARAGGHTGVVERG